jgi:hypothetical protein
VKIAIALCFVAVAAIAAEPVDPPVEQTKKNIKVLTGLPSSQLIPVMAFISNSLGVTCSHCHTDKWEADEKPAKETARKMLVMMRGINAQNFGGEPRVTCQTCHQGHVKPSSIPLLANAGWNQPAAPPKPSLPAADEVLARYIKAIGGEEAVQAATGRRGRGEVTRMNGRTAPVSNTFTITQELPQKVSIDTELSYPPEANREVGGHFYRVRALRSLYTSFAVTGIETIRGRSAYVVEATPKSGRPERLYFDRESGLLLRRALELATPVGILPSEYDFDDYRDAGGVKAPFLMTWSRADYRVTHKFDAIEPIVH